MFNFFCIRKFFLVLNKVKIVKNRQNYKYDNKCEIRI